jgi:hypothetical protein
MYRQDSFPLRPNLFFVRSEYLTRLNEERDGIFISFFTCAHCLYITVASVPDRQPGCLFGCRDAESLAFVPQQTHGFPALCSVTLYIPQKNS